MLLFAKGIEDYMLPCLNKKILGFECMGCGIQRSIALIFEGKLIDAFFMYPAIYTLIGFFGFLIVNSFKNFKNSNKIIFILAISNVIIIVGNFLIKLYLKQI
ncbi:DUF2752 domain-containing protein [uncultured Winogradskyella sp.]|uniref:DUF2752 domain-containing protein n=1 Tax=uncultured Winogradskyella sp. TaxID=395353 RepID=UPI0026349066|nr:DUF2752 domain-containing protein [uncultured Winogradskyella sp.]|tara:strand:+ start:178 stop:483 length:306 start_codon:yes stop_codon:yes gene_type:complete